MSKTIDNRGVQLGFDNKQFENGVKQSTESLNALKKGLDLSESAKSLNNLAEAGKRFNLASMSESIKNISDRFSTFGIIGMSVLNTLTNKAMEFGRKMWQSIIGPAKMGFSEYETQMNAIQTIMANTASKGTTLEQVNAALNELNLYADQTIYNFTEMARNIGTFTAAGVDLKTSVAAIKGIANLAAVSGSNSQQAATAMYQLSQALASGTVKLMDWNSVVNAGMGGQVFQDALKETARLHKINIDQMIKDEGSFRETLSKGWLTSAILTETLAKFTGDLGAEELRTIGYTEEQITKILELGKTANEAATKVKTLTQLKDTLAEALQSGWAQTWQIVIGDFEEAKSLFTYLSDTFGALIQQSSDSRNKMLQGWADLGGRTKVVESIKNVLNSALLIMDTFKQSWATMFPSKGKPGETLAKITDLLFNFSKALRPSMQTMQKFKIIFSGIFAILDIGKMAINALIGSFGKLNTKGIKPFLTSILDYIYKLAWYALTLRNVIKTNHTFEKAITSMKDTILGAKTSITDFANKAIAQFEKFKSKFNEIKENIQNGIKAFKDGFKSAFDFKKINVSGASNFIQKLKERFTPLESLSTFAGALITGLINLLKKSVPILLNLGTWLGKIFGGLANALSNAASNLDFNTLFDLFNAGFLTAFILAIKKFVTKGSDTLDSISGMFSGVSGILDGVRTSLEAYQKNLQSKTLLNIAVAIGILAASLLVMSLIDSEKLSTALMAVTALFADLVISMNSLSKGTGGGATGAMGLTVTLIGISLALLILTAAMKSLADIDPDELKNGLISLGAITGGLVTSVQILGKNGKSFAKAAISLILLSVAIKMLVGVVETLGAIDEGKLKNGLLALGVLLASLAAFTQLASSKMGVNSGLGIIGLAGAILIMTVAVEKFGNMKPNVLQAGLKTIGIILAEIGIFLQLTQDGKGVITTAIGVAILGASMLIFYQAIEKMGNLQWEQIAKGLATMAGVLLIIAAAVNLMPGFKMIFSAVGLLIIANAITILVTSLEQMGNLSVDQIKKSLITLGITLGIITVAMLGMQGALPGAVALITISGALFVLSSVLKILGTMKISEIGIALGALAGTFLVLGIAGYLLTPVVPTLLALGGAITAIGAGIAAMGSGMLTFSTGLATLAVSGVAGATALVGVVTIILGLVPVFIKAIMNGIILFAKLAIEAAPIVGQAFLTIIQTLCDVIIQATPSVVEALTVLIKGLLQLLRNTVPDIIATALFLIGELLSQLALSIPDFTQSAFDILIGFLQGIRDNIGEVVTVVGEIITEFLDALALKIPDIIQSGFDLLVSFIDGITKAITDEDNKKTLGESITKLADAIIKGLTDGILGGIKSITDAISKISGAIIDALKTLLGIASPSTVTREMGGNLAQGLVVGLIKNAGKIVDAAEEVGKKAITGLGGAIRRINDTVNENINADPTIRPVLDLTNIQNGSKSIDGMLAGKSLSLSQNMNNLSLAANGMGGNGQINEALANMGKQGTTIMFNQTNNSPKALSQFEIYRATKNQLLALKGLVQNK